MDLLVWHQNFGRDEAQKENIKPVLQMGREVEGDYACLFF